MRRLVALLFVLGIAAQAEAQAPVVSPGRVEFTAVDHNALDGTQNVITHYVVELWAPGSDTTLGSPSVTGQDVPKGTTGAVTGSANRYSLTLANWGLTVPPGPTWVMTIRAKGPGGTARSAASNPFSYPIPVRAPQAPTNVVVQ